MSAAQDLLALEAMVPWQREDFQQGLDVLRSSTARAAQQLAADARVLASLAAQVPRCPGDDRGATPWTSFRREVAVARSISDLAAALEIRDAVRLVRDLPRTLQLLDAGRTTAQRARAFVREVDAYDDELVRQLDDELAERVAGLPTWRIVQEVRRAAGLLEPEAAALRTAAKDADRSVVLQPQADDQATVVLTGPAVPLIRWYDDVDAQARARKQAGDPRTLAQLRFDVATQPHTSADVGADGAPAPATDRRLSRPVRASITVPVTTALGLSHEPAWLEGYGWLSAPVARRLLVDAELRRVCVDASSGELVDVAARDVRPPPTPAGVREALLAMVRDPVEPSATATRVEPQHDPSAALREHVVLRDRFCDGPTGTRTVARRCELDHEKPYPLGPTAAWNLTARATRTHQLKHYGWTPLRTTTSTIWFSPAGQVVEVPRHQQVPPALDEDAVLPDADALAELDALQLQAPDGEVRPWLPREEQVELDVQYLDPAPF